MFWRLTIPGLSYLLCGWRSSASHDPCHAPCSYSSAFTSLYSSDLTSAVGWDGFVQTRVLSINPGTVLVGTVVYFSPGTPPPSALTPDALAAALSSDPWTLFSAKFLEAYGPPQAALRMSLILPSSPPPSPPSPSSPAPTAAPTPAQTQAATPAPTSAPTEAPAAEPTPGGGIVLPEDPGAPPVAAPPPPLTVPDIVIPEDVLEPSPPLPPDRLPPIIQLVGEPVVYVDVALPYIDQGGDFPVWSFLLAQAWISDCEEPIRAAP